jgi:septin family protein
MDIEERGVRLRLSVVDTPGFGDSLDCDDSWRAVCTYVDQQFSQFFQVGRAKGAGGAAPFRASATPQKYKK